MQGLSTRERKKLTKIPQSKWIFCNTRGNMNDVSLFPRKNVTLFQIKVTINKNDYVTIAICRILSATMLYYNEKFSKGCTSKQSGTSKYQN